MLNGMSFDHKSAVTERLIPYVSNIFDEMSCLARLHKAINLGQGAPDFDGPPGMLECAQKAIASGYNQYPPGLGILPLRQAIIGQIERDYGIVYDAEQECLVTTGAAEGVAAALLGLLNPGDEVIVFEPYYDSYAALVSLAGARSAVSRLTRYHDGFRFDVEHATSLITDKTKAILLNSPHNPSGTVIHQEDLIELARLAHKHNLLVITDEVYEHLVYDGARHIPIASLEGMRERTVRISSAAKTFNVTGWKIGWVTAPHKLITAVKAAKQHLTFVSGGPFQYAIAYALENEREWIPYLRSIYSANKAILIPAVADSGFSVYSTQGSYFFLADTTPLGRTDAVQLCRELPELIKIAAIPVSELACDRNTWGPIIRFSFAVQTKSLITAAERLRSLPYILSTTR